MLIELYNWQTFVMTLVIAAFGLSVLYFFTNVRLSNGVKFPSIVVCLYNGFALRMLLQRFLLVSGVARRGEDRLQTEVEKAFPTTRRTA